MSYWRDPLCVCRNLTALLVAVLCLFLATAALYAQISNASINGTVRDATGAVVPETVILLRNTATGVESRTITNDQGIYIILNILPGNYTLEGSKPGFSTNRLEPFNLVVNQRSVFDFALTVGKVQDSISVEATGVQLQSATAELGSVLTRQQVVDLPAGRNIQNLMRLTPGVTAIGTGQSSIPSVNGQINRSSMYMLDGVNNQATFFSNLALNPIMETIEEFKVQSHNDSAEVGGVMGGVINTTTKSGTNELHGNVYDVEQNDAFNARNTFLASVAPFKGHTFGGTVGGPVKIPETLRREKQDLLLWRIPEVLQRWPGLEHFARAHARQPAGRYERLAATDLRPVLDSRQPGRVGYIRPRPLPRE